ncbi:acyl-CoA dehydrogenase family protein [Nonomuraea sp. NPDC049758]|uniref:acyl-CoA dehydrogenase family protein n=1 Tax=Nonomuraea sp. NPDC049758 TaxID=3154360 RepID=UPI003445D474
MILEIQEAAVDFSLSPEERQIRDTVRAFIEKEVMPLEPEVLRNEREGRPGLDPEVVRDLRAKARKSGFWGINTPEEYGGAALGPIMSAIIAMEMGRTFVPFSFGGSADNILYAGTDEQKQRYLVPTIEGERRSCFAITEPGAGSDARNIRTRATRDGAEWVINGEKTFITGGSEADFVMVFAVAEGHGVTCFLVDRDMGWKSEPIPTMGEWGPAALVFQDVRVPEENILGELGKGFELAMQWIGQGRYMIPARAIGSAERMLQMAIDYAKIRKSMGQTISEYQAIQWMIADSQVEIEAAKWLTLHAAWQVQQGMDARHASSIAKLNGAVMANQVVDRVLQIHGGMGYTKELPVERWYRELRLLRIFEGTDEIQRRTIARNLIKGHARLGLIGE